MHYISKYLRHLKPFPGMIVIDKSHDLGYHYLNPQFMILKTRKLMLGTVFCLIGSHFRGSLKRQYRKNS